MAAEAGASDPDGVQVTSLSAQELMGLRDNVEGQCNDLADKALQLQRLMAHYSSSNKAVQALAGSKAGQPLMIPLTESLYVPAKLADTERVLVDVGTGYYVQMGSEAASEFCQRKTTKMEGTLKTVTKNLSDQRRALSQIEEVLAMKMAAGRQQQQQQPQQQPQQQQIKEA